MLGTFTAAIVLILTYLFAPTLQMELQGVIHKNISYFLALPFALLLSQIGLWIGLQTPLLRMEEKLIPGTYELFRTDKTIKTLNGLLLVLLTSWIFALLSWPYLKEGFNAYLIMVSIFTLGVSIDLFYSLMQKMFAYLNPTEVLRILNDRAEESVVEGKEEEVCDALDSLSVVALKAITRNSTSMCNEALQKASALTRKYLESSAERSYKTVENSSAMNGEEKTQFVLFYLFDRLEMIYKKAAEQNFESICSSIMTLLGKLALHAAEYKVSFAVHPIQRLGQLSLEATEQKNSNLALKGTCTLVEISKAIAMNVNDDLPEFPEPHLSIIAYLDRLGKETFRKDKSTNIKLLTYPFMDLKAFFQTEKLKDQPSVAPILRDLDRLIIEWDTLESVMRTMPPQAQGQVG